MSFSCRLLFMGLRGSLSKHPVTLVQCLDWVPVLPVCVLTRVCVEFWLCALYPQHFIECICDLNGDWVWKTELASTPWKWCRCAKTCQGNNDTTFYVKLNWSAFVGVVKMCCSKMHGADSFKVTVTCYGLRLSHHRRLWAEQCLCVGLGSTESHSFFKFEA